ncbi:DUF4232 domain-containing protein [Dactylosporangium matsuzakiense]|nr:DUF4232 domain-containing protein [Dactylosporangium matsuzakiense]UWZ41876.1 DUF4232 domain-containing protein [Dactylosporangium matsuzakiense]
MKLRVVPLMGLLLLTACARPDQPGATQPTPGRTASVSAVPSEDVTEAACPPGGLKVTAERGDAAAGYREMSLFLANCGPVTVTVNGRPDIVVLGKDRDVQDIAVVASVHYNPSPHPIVLKPGTRTSAVMSWRNTYDDISKPPVVGVYLSVAATPGVPRQLVKPPSSLDLGSTGRLEVSAWL